MPLPENPAEIGEYLRDLDRRPGEDPGEDAAQMELFSVEKKNVVRNAARLMSFGDPVVEGLARELLEELGG